MNKQVIRNKEICADYWRYLDNDDAIPDTGEIIIDYQRWSQEKAVLSNFAGKLGVVINSDVQIGQLENDLKHFKLIAIRFTEFKDGRGYSLARLLRERYHFQGELRATGNVLRDQIFYMHRCGFDSFEVDEGRNLEEAIDAFSDFHVSYQPAVNAQ